jgi:TRAP transporter TAXI family solute receptor
MVRRRIVLFASIGAAAIAGIALLWAVTILHPLPPRAVVMTTGPEGGAYHEVGKRYREILARSGVDLRLLPSAGGIENLRRLGDPRSGVSVGFEQGGTTSKSESPDLESLGELFYEPVWFFHRRAPLDRKLSALRGKRISIGPEGSGTRSLALMLFARLGIDPGFAEFLPYPPEVARNMLLADRIEAAVIVAGWDSPVVRELIASDDVELASFPRADAYVAMYPYLKKVVLPAGVGNMERNRPPSDTTLIAPVTSLVVRSDLHPAIQYLLLEAATEIHSVPGIFRKAGQFPAAAAVDLPLSERARQFYKSGRPFLQRYLPFWFAVLLEQALVLLIPVVGVLYPLMRLLPAAYGFGMRRRIFRLYGELKFLDGELDRLAGGEGTGDLAAQLERLESRASHLKVPVYYTNMLFALRRDIHLVRRRLERM